MDALYPHTLPLIRKLESITTLSSDDRAALLRLPMQVRDLRADQDIVREGDQPSQCCLILEGFAATYKLGPKGKRQIMAFHIPGDIPDLQSLPMEVMDTNLATMSACKVAFIRHPHMRELCHLGFGQIQPQTAQRCFGTNSFVWGRPRMLVSKESAAPVAASVG